MDLLSTFDVERILDIKRTRLQEWMDRGFIKPSQQSQGKGTKALFSREDLYAIKLFEELLKRGFNRDNASKLTNHLVGYPILHQDRSVEWDSDFFSIFEASPDAEEELKKMNLPAIMMSYGKIPEDPYYRGNEKFKEKNFIHTIINLKVIKQIVDGKIG